MLAMSDLENDRKFELERLRVASDLRQLASETLDPDLREHCQRLAKQWSDEADEPAKDDIGVDKGPGSMMVTTAGKALPVVLVVEDEPLLRMLAVEAVEEAGFNAIEARDADEAVILLESRADITLLFTDINMPGSMDGLKLAHAVRHRWPPIKILVVSGKHRPQSSELPLNSCFFGKPYQVSALVKELRSMVGSP